MTRIASLLLGLILPAFTVAAEKSVPVDPPAADELVKVIESLAPQR